MWFSTCVQDTKFPRNIRVVQIRRDFKVVQSGQDEGREVLMMKYDRCIQFLQSVYGAGQMAVVTSLERGYHVFE